VADGLMASYCLDLPSEFRFLRVRAGDMVNPPVGEGTFIDAVLSLDNNQICLEWPSKAGDVFTVEASSGLDGANWNAIQQVTATGDLTRYCVDLPTPYRLFRVRIGGSDPGPTDQVVTGYVDTVIIFDQDRICLQWNAVVGRDYLIQGVDSVGSEAWQNVEKITADAESMQFCLTLPTPYQVFRIGLLSENQNPEPVVSNYIDPIMALGENQICLSWQPLDGMSYQVQGLADVQQAEWTVVDRLPASTEPLNYCIDLPAEHTFYRIAVVETPPGNDGGQQAPQPASIDSVQWVDGQVEVQWTGLPGRVYRVSYADSLLGPWQEIDQSVTSDTASFVFSDDGTQTGGLGSPRFYRVVLLPVP